MDKLIELSIKEIDIIAGGVKLNLADLHHKSAEFENNAIEYSNYIGAVFNECDELANKQTYIKVKYAIIGIAIGVVTTFFAYQNKKYLTHKIKECRLKGIT